MTSARPLRSHRLTVAWLAAGVIAVGVAVAIGSAVGPAGFGWVRGWGIMQIRLPRVVLALLVGWMLSGAGAAYQGVFRNALADPYLLGAAAGAGFGATIIIAFGRTSTHRWPIDPLPLAAFVGAIAAVAIAYALGAISGSRSTTSILLAGVAVASFFTALQTFIQQQHDDTLRRVYSWILGSLNQADWRSVRLVLPYAIVTTVVLLMHGRSLDVLRVGDLEAGTLGLNTARTRLLVIGAATMAAAAAVAVSGLIGFVGIIVPHFVRMVAGSSYRRVLPLSMLFGGAFLVLADVVARSAQSPREIPIGVVTAFFGAPFFVLVLRKRSRGTQL
jgi:iron complex transport system permease protein